MNISTMTTFTQCPNLADLKRFVLDLKEQRASPGKANLNARLAKAKREAEALTADAEAPDGRSGACAGFARRVCGGVPHGGLPGPSTRGPLLVTRTARPLRVFRCVSLALALERAPTERAPKHSCEQESPDQEVLGPAFVRRSFAPQCQESARGRSLFLFSAPSREFPTRGSLQGPAQAMLCMGGALRRSLGRLWALRFAGVWAQRDVNLLLETGRVARSQKLHLAKWAQTLEPCELSRCVSKGSHGTHVGLEALTLARPSLGLWND